MNLLGLIVLLFVVISVVLVYRWYIKDQKEIVSEWDAGKQPKLIDSDKLSLSTNSRHTFSVWFYLKKWQKTDKKKIVFQRLKKGTASMTAVPLSEEATYANAASKGVFFHMQFDKTYPHLETYVRIGEDVYSKCVVENIPIQRWVNVICSVDANMMDIYVDGKLYKHCEFTNAVHEIAKDTSIYIFGESTIQGKISKLEYIKKNITPQRAWDIYVDGPRDSSLIGNWLNRYMLRIQWLKDGTVEKEATL